MANFKMQDDDSQEYTGGVFYLKMVTKKDETPCFTVKTKEGNLYIDLPEKPQSLKGNLKNIEIGSYSWENKEIRTVKFVVEKETPDGKQLAIISSSYTSTLRSIINSILNVEKPIKEFGLHMFTNKAGYNGCFTTINGSKATWKYDQEFLKTKIVVEKTRKGDIIDYDDLDLFLEEELQKHLSVILPGSLVITEEISDEAATDMDEFFVQADEEDPIDKLFGKEEEPKKKKK